MPSCIQHGSEWVMMLHPSGFKWLQIVRISDSCPLGGLCIAALQLPVSLVVHIQMRWGWGTC